MICAQLRMLLAQAGSLSPEAQRAIALVAAYHLKGRSMSVASATKEELRNMCKEWGIKNASNLTVESMRTQLEFLVNNYRTPNHAPPLGDVEHERRIQAEIGADKCLPPIGNRSELEYRVALALSTSFTAPGGQADSPVQRSDGAGQASC